MNIYKKCIFCKKEVEWKTAERIFANGTRHIQGTCFECGYTKLLPQEKIPEECIFHFGKHKGKNITEVPTDYLLWCLKEDVVGGGMALATLEYLQKKGIDIINYRNSPPVDNSA